MKIKISDITIEGVKASSVNLDNEGEVLTVIFTDSQGLSRQVMIEAINPMLKITDRASTNRILIGSTGITNISSNED
jgi:hypothetical protein